jgi:inositol phosphorylceramide mannosyltransferase catalytic subunit
MRIPRIVHQTCPDPSTLPVEITTNISGIKSLNPNWDYRLYSDSDVVDYLRRNVNNAAYEAIRKINPKYGVVLADLFRYLVIYNEGGVYLDIKSKCSRPLDEVIQPSDVFLLSQWRNRYGEEQMGAGLYPELVRVPGGEFQQWHVIAAPKHPFLRRVIQQTIFNIKTYDPLFFGVGKIGVLRLSGPICYTLSIAPLVRRYPCSVVDIQSLGFAYTLYGDLGDGTLHMKSASHYSRLTEPIIF